VPTLGARKLEEYEDGDAWRTYHPYYSMGNFETLVHVNTRSRHAKFLPEPFVWFTLHRMMRAAVAMDERLQDTPGQGPYVIHNDIKSQNIFFGSSWLTRKGRGLYHVSTCLSWRLWNVIFDF
jgi:hypothetical protein